MSLFRLLLRNLLYHWRGNVPVLLGVVVGATVLTGALLVGDSLQGSLRDRTLRRLGWVDQALVAPRFFRAALAEPLEKTAQGRVVPALMLQATAGGGKSADRSVTVLGVDAAFFAPGQPPEGFGAPGTDRPRAWISRALADALNVKAGDSLALHLQKPDELPRENVLANKDVQIETWPLTVGGVLEGDDPGNLFNLRPELQAPRNILVSLPDLQRQLQIPGQVNALFAAADPAKLKSALKENLSLADWGLTVNTPSSRAKALYERVVKRRGQGKPLPGVVLDAIKPAKPRRPTRQEIENYFRREHPYLALESKQLLLSPAVAAVALEAARECDLRTAPTLVYLCRLESAGQRIAGVVAALPLDRPWPLGPFLPPGKKVIGEDEIVLVDQGWNEKRPAVGDKVVLTFKPPESHGPALDRTRTFRLAGYIPLKGVAADPYLTPEFPGITDKDSTSDWKLPFDDPKWDREIIRKEYGDRFWEQYRATPRAYIRLPAGQELWRSRFGELTSIRLAPEKTPAGLDEDAKRFGQALLHRLNPEDGGFVFDEVKKTALDASKGATPFGVLFLCFSFFLILSALLLVGLLFRLNLDRRARQVGVLFAEGYPRRTVRWLLLGEGGVLALVGVVLGGAAALGYSRLLVDLLAALWPGGALKSFLTPHYTWFSLLVGAAGALAVSLLTIAWVVRGLSKTPPRALLAGQTTGEGDPGPPSPPRWQTWATIASAPSTAVLGAVFLVVGPFVPGQEAKAGTFFGSGALFLTAGILGLLVWMRRGRFARVEGHGWWSVARLGVRNAARHPARSLLTVGLLASASFLIVAVESFRRTAKVGNGDISAPDGGFSLVGESNLPLIRDPNSQVERNEMLDRLDYRLRNEEKKSFEEAEKEKKAAEALLKDTTIVSLRRSTGDDASCLNLYQPRRPRILGVPKALIERGGFVFASSLAKTPQEKANPWLILLREGADVPAFGEANTVTYQLQKSQGQTIDVPDEKGNNKALLIAGLLHDSVFQSSLLVSEERFLQLYPRHEGYNYFLIAPPPGKEEEVRRLLEQVLANRGLEVELTKKKLEAYLEVENTYLSTFQSLGGLGLVLGALGLAVVLLRAVWERQAELALLRALGFRRRMLAWLVLAENSFLLLMGLLVGAVSALLSILPQLLSGEGSAPWGKLALLLAAVLAVALGAGMAATAGVLRAPIVPALRRE